jgi:copper chaperone
MKVPDISCGHCVAAVENALKQLEGVESVHVSLETKIVKVRAIKELTSEDLMGAVRDAGYTPELEK